MVFPPAQQHLIIVDLALDMGQVEPHLQKHGSRFAEVKRKRVCNDILCQLLDEHNLLMFRQHFLLLIGNRRRDKQGDI